MVAERGCVVDIMSCSGKYPPKFQEEDDYEQWRRDVEIWTELTDFDKSKQALAIHLALQGRARVAASELTVAELKAEDGVKKLLEKLDSLFLHEIGRRQFANFRDMYRLKRDGSVGIDQFVSQFQHAYYKLKSQSVELPDTVLAFMLLESCNLDEKEEQLILSGMSEIKFDSMKAALKRVFGGKGNQIKCSVDKTEPTFYENSSENSNETLYTKSWRGSTRGGGRWQRGSRGNHSNNGRVQMHSNRGRAHVPNIPQTYNGANFSGVSRKTNPIDRDGNVMRCIICESKFHFARECQHSYENDKKSNKTDESDSPIESEIVQLSLLVAYTNQSEGRKLNQLVKDSFGCAILDSGCSTSVCGQQWFEEYEGSLTTYDQSLIEEKEASNTSFTFGDGNTYKSLKRVILPCWIAGMKANIEVDVVECNIPLLLSKKAMKKGKMCLKFVNDSVTNCDKTFKLEETSSGHYILPLKF